MSGQPRRLAPTGPGGGGEGGWRPENVAVDKAQKSAPMGLPTERRTVTSEFIGGKALQGSGNLSGPPGFAWGPGGGFRIGGIIVP